MNLKISMTMLLAAMVVLIGLIAHLPGMKSSAAKGSDHVQPGTPSSDSSPTPVLVELFTSEGCSSCPPADALLRRLGRTQPVRGADVIVLEEHVNYWDRLGWKDPFSSEEVTSRQGDYGESFGGEQVYTPQMVVDGHAEFVGSYESQALSAIRNASKTPKPEAHLTWVDGDRLSIEVAPLTNAARGDNAQVYVAVTENMLRSDVKRGENAGRELDHDGVVRTLTPVGKITSGSAGFFANIAVHTEQGWNRSNLRAVVFVQELHSRHILAASAIPFLTE